MNQFFCITLLVSSLFACGEASFSDVEEETQELRVQSSLYGEPSWLSFVDIDGVAVHQGDIVLGNLADMKVLTLEDSLKEVTSQNSGILQSTGLWPDAIIPYQIEKNLSNPRFDEAIASWENNTSIRFVKRTTESDYVSVTVTPGGLCTSTLGYQRGTGAHNMNIGAQCVKNTYKHMLGHMIGFYHEHVRPDRDQYIRVSLENVDPMYRASYEIRHDLTEIGPYDTLSIMHAHSHDGASGVGAVIEGINGNRVNDGFYANNPSAGDRANIDWLYRREECKVVEVGVTPEGLNYATGTGGYAVCDKLCRKWGVDKGLESELIVGLDGGMRCTLR